MIFRPPRILEQNDTKIVTLRSCQMLTRGSAVEEGQNDVLCRLKILLWSPYGIGQTIVFSCCDLFFLLLLLLFFPRLSQPPQIGCLPYFHTWCGLSANSRCRSETCCTRLAENTGRKKSPQKSPSGHHRTTLSGYIFATKARIDNRKKTC